MRWCSTPGRTPTTCFISTTVWGRSCWISTTGSLVFCRVSGTKAKTFPWRWAQTSFHTSWRLNWRLKINLFQYNSLSSIFNFFYCFHISTFPHTQFFCISWHLSQFTLPPHYRNMWSLYTQRSHIWRCRGSRKGLSTPSSSLPSDCCLPGGTSWPGRKMKAPGRLFGNEWTRFSGNPLLERFLLFMTCAQPDFCNPHASVTISLLL